MKKYLSLVLYYIGDLISKYNYYVNFRFNSLNWHWVYSLECKIMGWSCDLDEKCEIWKKPELVKFICPICKKEKEENIPLGIKEWECDECIEKRENE